MSDKEIIVSANETETKKKTSFFRSRGFKYGSLATALTAALIVLVIAANMVLSLILIRGLSTSLRQASTKFLTQRVR